MPTFKRILTAAAISGGLLFLAACMPFTITYNPQGYDETVVMSTVQVKLTEIDLQTRVARLTESLTPTLQTSEEQATATTAPVVDDTPTFTATPTGSQQPVVESATPTMTTTTIFTQAPAAASSSTSTFTPLPPAATATATATSQPTATRTNTATLPAYPTATTASAGSTYCNSASFVQDVSVPDMTRFTGGMSFTKTWRLKNTGTCTWNSNYALVFDSGNTMSGPQSLNLTRTVAPGETVDISVNLAAPGYPQVYTGYWKLQADDGTRFGIGARANGVFWVQIQVVENMKNSFVLFEQFCNASWISNKGSIACPGSYNTTSGSISLVTDPYLERGNARKDQPSLVAIPGEGTGGFITGTFPAYHIKPGDHFHTHIACLDDHASCDVTFTLSFLDANGVSHNLLGPVGQTSDGYIEEYDIDLNPYQNTTVQFVLTVQNNGSSTDDYAVWFYPIVWNN